MDLGTLSPSKNGFKALFQAWELDSREEVMKRAQTEGLNNEGIKVLGIWADLAGDRCCQLSGEPADPKLSITASFEWSDILKVGCVTVVDAVYWLFLKPVPPGTSTHGSGDNHAYRYL